MFSTPGRYEVKAFYGLLFERSSSLSYRRSNHVPRTRVIEETINSERTYVNFLRILSDNFEIPLRLNHMIPVDVHNAIFRNLQAILRVNEELFDHLSHMDVGEAFLEMAPFLKLYSHYARYHHQAVNILQEWCSKSIELKEFITAQEKKTSVGMKISALLIMPVQRIPRYEMLLRELLRVTPSNLYRDQYESLSRALDAVIDVACHINEHVRLGEDEQHMRRIQERLTGRVVPRLIAPGRRFIKEGIMKKVSHRRGSAHDRIFFLFSDILMYAKAAAVTGENPASLYSCRLECCSIFPLHHCHLEQLFGLTRDADAVMLKISCKRKCLILFVPNRSDGEDWLDALECSIRKLQRDRQTLRKESSAMEPMRAARFNKVMVMKRKIEEESMRYDEKEPSLSPKRQCGGRSEIPFSGITRRRHRYKCAIL